MLKNTLCLSLLLLVLTVVGCAQPKLPRFVIPPPPDTPRYEFIQLFYSELDFTRSNLSKSVGELVGEDPVYTFSTPFGIASDGKGVVYVSDIHQHNVRVYDFNSGSVHLLAATAPFATPVGMTVDSKGNIYVADAGVGKVFAYAGIDKPLLVYEDADHLKKPSAVAISPDQKRLYVSDAMAGVAVFDLASGKFLFDFAVPSPPKWRKSVMYSPQGLAFSPKDGLLYVVDIYNARINTYSADGEYISSFGERGDQPGTFENPRDIAFDSDGNIYVPEGRRNVVQIFDPDFNLLMNFGAGSSSGSAWGFASPRHVFIDQNDRIYVAEALGKRFVVWQYMSESYLKRNPFTEADRDYLMEYMGSFKKGK